MRRYMSAALLVLLVSVAGGATIYVDAENGSDTGGDGSQGSPYASMTKVFSVVAGGDTVLLQPGNYGSLTLGKNKGVGSDSTGWITYLADPSTCTPRPAAWYEDSLSRPVDAAAEGKVVFSGVLFDYYSSDLNTTDKTGTPDGHYIILDGINVIDGNITLKSYVSYVVVRNCNIFGTWSDYSSEVTGTSVNLYRAYSLGSNYRHILVEGCYSTHCGSGAMLLGNFYDVTIRGNHFHHFCGSGLRVNGVMDSVLIEGNHVHHQIPLADYVKSRHAVTGVDGSEPDRIITIEPGGNYWDHATVIDASDGTKILSEVESYNNATGLLTLAEALPFTAAAGDSVWLWDDTHGSGLAVRADNFTFRGNRIHGCGGSRGLYFYDRAYSDVIIEDNLFYSTTNYTVDLRSAMGSGCRVIHNTFAGTRHPNYYGNGDADMAYGHAIIGASADAAADPKTIIIANNVFAGFAGVGSDMIVKNNIVFSGSGFEEDSEGDNAGNLVYYNNEPAGSEPSPFHQAAGFFMGGDGFDDGFLTRHQENFNAFFALAEGSDAIGFADPAYATGADMTGTSRDGSPDAGCYEYSGSAVTGDVRKPEGDFGVKVTPNPMISTLTIAIETSRSDTPHRGVSTVRVEIFDQTGNVICLPSSFDSAQDDGVCTWDGKDYSGHSAVPGMYFYRVTVGDEGYSGKIFKVR